jgi:hypothetical protein
MEYNEPSYFVQLYYDALYDDICFYTLYRFDTVKLAKQFLDIADSNINVECENNIFFNIRKTIHNNDNLRPLMTDIDIAIKDLDKFKEYCDTYYYNQFKYSYKDSVHEEDLKDYELVKIKNENKLLKIENASLKAQIHKAND